MNTKLSTIIAITMAITPSCHTQKSVSTATAEETAIAQSRHETILSTTSDSLFRSLTLTFDTIDVWVEDKPLATLPEDEQCRTLRLRAVRGKLATNQQQKSTAEQSITAADTTSLAHSANGQSQESATQTSVYRPPDLTWIFGIALFIVAGILLYIYKTRRNQ